MQGTFLQLVAKFYNKMKYFEKGNYLKYFEKTKKRKKMCEWYFSIISHWALTKETSYYDNEILDNKQF